MKKIIFTFILFPSIFFGQDLVENKVDEFTKASVKRTSWEVLNKSSNNFSAEYQIVKINDSKALNFKMMKWVSMSKPQIFSISKGMEIMFKLDNEEIVSIYNTEHKIACTGCGATGFIGSAAPGINATYMIDDASFEKLSKNKVVKIRVYTNDGYLESEIKDKRADEFIKSLKLVI